jgi:adenosine deaminase
MDNLRNSIELLFRKINTETIVTEIGNTDLSVLPFQTKLKNDFIEFGRASSPHYSKSEWENIVQKLEEDWLLNAEKPVFGEGSVFSLLIHFTIQALSVHENVPTIVSAHLLRWRELSYVLGEDLLICAHFGYIDSKKKTQRDFFGWAPVISTDNIEIKNILNKGIAENHFHLKGSAPIFELSWISLMNNVKNRSTEFRKLRKKNRQVLKQIAGVQLDELTIETQVYIAAIIRKTLFNLITNGEADLDSLQREITSGDFRIMLNNHQTEIERLKKMHGLSFRHEGKTKIPDYAITKDLLESNLISNVLLCGERKLLISCFTEIYRSSEKIKDYLNVFYLYLLIKNKLREELIQVNNKIGFSNFSDYQDRKEYFIKEKSIFETAFLSMAVSDTSKNQKIVSFETRIAPKQNYPNQKRAIEHYDHQINSTFFNKRTTQEKINRMIHAKSTADYPNFYVLHFIKEKEKRISIDNSYDSLSSMAIPRHNILRKKVRQESIAIIDLMRSSSNVSQRLFGIDAAASELDTRPEVFAQAFRFLKNHESLGRHDHLKSNHSNNRLGATYHCGEDFLDLVDGLRAIDEAILFLNLTKGDRLGHALALGVEVQKYYEFKHRLLMLPKQDVLDNVVWLLEKYTKYEIQGFRKLITFLEETYERLFSELYVNKFEVNIKSTWQVYADAWKLRGDDPLIYKRNSKQSQSISNWNSFNTSRSIADSIRFNEDVKFLYHSYHFDPNVKVEGRKIMQFQVTQEYINLVKIVQDKFLYDVSRKELGIECNPSSNYLIGTFGKYVQHPIKRFFNSGLTLKNNELGKSPQALVSINTDDQGVFGTSLENEYAIMYKALEKELDLDGNPIYNQTMIIDWLDRIRKMGIEMSFKK